MSNQFQDKIICGSVPDAMEPIPDGTFQTCITSPPYWGLRCYNLPPTVWDGDPECGHEWGADVGCPTKIGKQGSTETRKHPTLVEGMGKPVAGSFCVHCGAWLDCLGLEPTPDCGRPFMELRDDLTEKEQDFVITELLRLGILDTDPRDNKPR